MAVIEKHFFSLLHYSESLWWTGNLQYESTIICICSGVLGASVILFPILLEFFLLSMILSS